MSPTMQDSKFEVILSSESDLEEGEILELDFSSVKSQVEDGEIADDYPKSKSSERSRSKFKMKYEKEYLDVGYVRQEKLPEMKRKFREYKKNYKSNKSSSDEELSDLGRKDSKKISLTIRNNSAERKSKQHNNLKGSYGTVEDIMTQIDATLCRKSLCNYKKRKSREIQYTSERSHRTRSSSKETKSRSRHSRPKKSSSSESDSDSTFSRNKKPSRNKIPVCKRKREKELKRIKEVVYIYSDDSLSDDDSAPRKKGSAVKKRDFDECRKELLEKLSKEKSDYKSNCENIPLPEEDLTNSSDIQEIEMMDDTNTFVDDKLEEINSKPSEAASKKFMDSFYVTRNVPQTSSQPQESEGEDDDTELIKLRLLALTSNRKKKEAVSDDASNHSLDLEHSLNVDAKSEENVSDKEEDSDLDRNEFLLRAEALKTALLKKRKFKKAKENISDNSDNVKSDKLVELTEEKLKVNEEINIQVRVDVPETNQVPIEPKEITTNEIASPENNINPLEIARRKLLKVRDVLSQKMMADPVSNLEIKEDSLQARLLALANETSLPKPSSFPDVPENPVDSFPMPQKPEVNNLVKAHRNTIRKRRKRLRWKMRRKMKKRLEAYAFILKENASNVKSDKLVELTGKKLKVNEEINIQVNVPESNQVPIVPESNQVPIVPESNQVPIVPESNQVLIVPESNQVLIVPESNQVLIVPESNQVLIEPESNQVPIEPKEITTNEIESKCSKQKVDEDDEKLRIQLLNDLNMKKLSKENDNLQLLEKKASEIVENKPLVDKQIINVKNNKNSNNSTKIAPLAKVPKAEIQRIIVHLGPDSSDDEDLEPEVKPPNSLVPNSEKKVIEEIPSSTVVNNTNPLLADYEKSVELLLQKARQEVEGRKEKNQKSVTATPEAVYKHLPPSQRLEYMRLKQKIAEKENLKKKTTEANSNPSQTKSDSNKNSNNSSLNGIKRIVAASLRPLVNDNQLPPKISNQSSSNLQTTSKSVSTEKKIISPIKCDKINPDSNQPLKSNSVNKPAFGNAVLSPVKTINNRLKIANPAAGAKKIITPPLNGKKPVVSPEQRKTIAQNQANISRLKLLLKKIKIEKTVEEKYEKEIQKLKNQLNLLELKRKQQRIKIESLAKESKKIYATFQSKRTDTKKLGDEEKVAVNGNGKTEDKKDGQLENNVEKEKRMEMETSGIENKETSEKCENQTNILITSESEVKITEPKIGPIETQTKSLPSVSSSTAPDLKKYDSPLQAFTARTEDTDGKRIDPNAIMCQYDLLGKCNDKECTFQHCRTS